MNQPPNTPEPESISEQELIRRYDEYLRRLREIKIEEVLKNSPIQDGEPLSEQLEAALQRHIYQLRQEILWSKNEPSEPS